MREKLSSWLHHGRTLLERARQEAREHIRTAPPFALPGDKQRALDEIYARAEATLAG